MTTGLFIGRFQPLHRGHCLVIKKYAKQVDTLIIGVGSANAQPSCKNPFKAEERIEMLKRGLKELGVQNYKIVEIPDCENDNDWIKNIKKIVGEALPQVDWSLQNMFIWSGSEMVIKAFASGKLPIVKVKEFPGLSSTKIRKYMTQGRPWIKYIPLSVRKYLKEIKAVKKVRILCKPQ